MQFLYTYCSGPALKLDTLLLLCIYSHFQLSFSERYSYLQLCGGWDTDKYSSLAHMPTQDSKDYHNLGEILSNGQNLNQQHVNILAMIKQVGFERHKYLLKVVVLTLSYSSQVRSMMYWGFNPNFSEWCYSRLSMMRKFSISKE